jgi:hypothetical protein
MSEKVRVERSFEGENLIVKKDIHKGSFSERAQRYLTTPNRLYCWKDEGGPEANTDSGEEALFEPKSGG